MHRLALVIVLVVATASAKHVKKERRNHEDSWKLCYGRNHPISQCTMVKAVDSPVIAGLFRAGFIEDYREILLAEGAIESLCNEGTTFFSCINRELKKASPECRSEYANQDISTELVNKALSLVALLCTPENIQIATRNVDCVVNENLLYNVSDCALRNPDHDCSYLKNGNYSSEEENACYNKLFRRNCNAEQVVQCAANKVRQACTAEAGRFVALAGNAFFERFDICRRRDSDREGNFGSLVKFFKK